MPPVRHNHFRASLPVITGIHTTRVITTVVMQTSFLRALRKNLPLVTVFVSVVWDSIIAMLLRPSVTIGVDRCDIESIVFRIVRKKDPKYLPMFRSVLNSFHVL